MIDIKKNPETVGKLKVGTSSATPADGAIVAEKVGIGTEPIADSKLDIAGAGTQRLYVRETGSTVKTKLLTTTSKGAVGTETNHPLELQTNDQTRAIIDSTGNLFLGKTNSGTSKTNKLAFQQYDSGTESEGYAALFNYALSGNNNLLIGGGSASHNAATKLEFYTAANETTRTGTARLTIASDGLCTFSNGIAFQSATTGSGTGVGYTLDSYEYGTFTPTLYGGTTAGTYDFNTAVGKYTRIGNMVTVNVSLIDITATVAGSGQILFGGFPFASGSSSTQGYIGAARVRSYIDAGSSPIVYMGGGASVATMSQYVSGSSDAICQVSGISSTNTDISFSLTYFV